MRTRFFVSVIAAAGMGIAVLINPSAATAVAAPAEPGSGVVSSCASPPDTPAATPENRDRFVGLWIARIQDEPWMKAFNKSETVPADVRAEGFHDMDGQTQLWLNACLLDKMMDIA